MKENFTTPGALIALTIGFAIALIVWGFIKPDDKADPSRRRRYQRWGRMLAFGIIVTVAALAILGDPKPGVYFAGGAGHGIIFLKPQKAGGSYLDADPVGKGRIVWVGSFGAIKVKFDGEQAIIPLPFWNDQILVGGVVYRRSTKPPSSENYETEIGFR